MSRDITDADLDAHAGTTVRALAAVEKLMESPNLDADDKASLRAIGDSVADTTAMLAASVRANRDTDALVGGNPRMIVEAIRRRCDPGQIRLLCRDLGDTTEP